MKRDTLFDIVGDEPLFTTGMLVGPGADLKDVRKQLSRWTKDGTVLQLRRGLYALAPPYRRRDPHPGMRIPPAVRRRQRVQSTAELQHGAILRPSGQLLPDILEIRPGPDEHAGREQRLIAHDIEEGVTFHGTRLPWLV